MRLILVPQFPQKLRYQEWWFTEFPKNLSHYFDEIIVLGKNSNLITIDQNENLNGMFSSIDLSIKFELEQIKEYSKMKIYDDDILLCLDISFPGFFNNILFHKRPNKSFAFCHATSVNKLDYFEPINYNFDDSKCDSEKSFFKIYDKVFVSTKYHKNKLLESGFPDNIVELKALPNPPFRKEDILQSLNSYKYNKRKNKIISVSRPNPQKVNLGIEKFVEKEFNTNIIRKDCSSWEEYFSFLEDSKILLLTGKEDTYGYSIIDAFITGCNVVAPNDLSYPELLTQNNLYYRDDLSSLKNRIDSSLEEHTFKKLRNQDSINLFYDNLVMYIME